VTVEREMGAETGVKNRIILQNHYSGYDGVESRTTFIKNGPAGGESAVAPGVACVDGFVRDVPGAAMNNERRCHRE
jgi:hypothetical protein